MQKLMIFFLITSLLAASSSIDDTKSKRIMSEEELLRELFNPNATEKVIRNRDLMGEIDKAIPEDQLGAFWEKVENKSQRLDEATAHMNEEEVRAYLQEVYAQEGIKSHLLGFKPSVPKEAVPQTPEPVVKVKQVKKEKKIKPAPVSVKEPVDTSKIIKSLITSIDNFINKIAMFPDYERKVSSWAKQHLLIDWPAEQTWHLFKDQLQQFNSLLHRFQEKDIKIGMKHIDALSKNNQVVQSLELLDIKLIREVPVIDVGAIGGSPAKKISKNAMAHVINALTEAMYAMKLNESLQKIIAEFEPVEKKLGREEVKIVDKPESISSFPLSSLTGKADTANPLKLSINTIQ